MSLPFDNSYARLPERFYQRTRPTPVKSPKLVVFNQALSESLGLPDSLSKDPRAADYFSGNALFPDSEPLALAYAGHQFGGFSPQLGDGRAHLLGEIVTPKGQRFDIQLKGSGPTAFSRGGDGRAALGPVLREYLVSESMHALGVPTTRSLAAVTTGEPIHRATVLPGAVLTRLASSHLRVGTFEYFGARGDTEALALLVNYALSRHYPSVERSSSSAQVLLDCVISAQAKLVAHWMSIGFVHGVMNTDNCTISGETIDYGPCAFLDAFDPTRTFSSIDHGGRYAYERQPVIAQWNLARLAEALLPLIHEDEEQAVATATELLRRFPERYREYRDAHSATKLGIAAIEYAARLDQELQGLMAEERADFTLTYYYLDQARKGDAESFLGLFENTRPKANEWLHRYQAAVAQESNDRVNSDRVSRDRAPQENTPTLRNPLYIPRNLALEDALDAAQEGDLNPFFRLLRAVQAPFDELPEFADLKTPPGREQWSHVTFCGT